MISDLLPTRLERHLILPPLAAAIEITDIGLADDGNHWFFGGVGILGVTGRGSSSNGQKSDDDKL